MNLWAKRVLAFAIGTLTPITALLALRAFDQGRWSCRICCREEERSVWSGLVLRRDEIEPSTSQYDVAGTFNRWFESRVRLEHAHDWVQSGCHMEWRGLSSYLGLRKAIRGWIYYHSLPALPDQEVARELVVRFVRHDVGERDEMLDDLQRDPGPFDVFAEKPIKSREFAAAYEAWASAHPLWR